MKQLSKKNTFRSVVKLSVLPLLFFFLLLSSFTATRMVDDFLKQLGIGKVAADEKIINTILGGSIDTYGVKNVKNILAGNRKAITLDLLAYTKKQVNSAAFIKQYAAMKEKAKPELAVAQTPEEMRNADIAAAKKGIADIEATIKKADATNKPIFEKVLVEAKKSLIKAEDPNNKQYVNYAKGYDGLVKDFKAMNEKRLAKWEEDYPTNHLLYVKERLVQFIDATNDIDFSAETVIKNGKKVFVNPLYERKGNQWKMAFCAGKEVIEPAREFVQQWIAEIN